MDNTPCVVPLVGTWIEISEPLKCGCQLRVVPLVGTWIEIDTSLDAQSTVPRRAPRGHVD